ncbi:MAG: hypothetical protein DME09_20390 [Candidatus Rokuibacteriota bacterium]|nr:MAG: hypothetical protein DME09_20390 [Candidatus Rokubacteria bacterium]
MTGTRQSAPDGHLGPAGIRAAPESSRRPGASSSVGLRRTCATLLLQVGVPPQVVQQRLGHMRIGECSIPVT